LLVDGVGVDGVFRLARLSRKANKAVENPAVDMIAPVNG